MPVSKPYRSISGVTTSATTAQISDGATDRVAMGTGKWRLSDTGSFAAGEFIVIPADLPWPLAKNSMAFARGDSATVTIYVGDTVALL